MTDPLAARTVALELLGAVLDRRTPLDKAVGTQPKLARLSTRDRAFARLLVATTLRRLGQIDAALRHCLLRPLPRSAARTYNALRLGACQLLFLGTPPHAAVDSSVTLAQGRRKSPFGKLANAVLRRLAREGEAIVATQDAARLNTPDWLWRSWSTAYGETTARAIANAHLEEPPLDLTVKADPEGWAGRLDARVLATGSLRRPAGGRIEALAGYTEGAWWVQDVAAAMPARLLGDVQGARVLEMCAAPGGKTAQLAAAGARVTALDRSERRLGRLTENLRRLRLIAETVCADGTEWRAPEPFPFVLLDAPCTASGALRRHPDIAHIKRRGDVAALAPTQARLADAAVANLAAGGVLVYCVCSLEPEEGEARVAELLGRHPELRRRPIRPAEIGGLSECLTKEGDLRTLPCHLAEEGGLDGFFAARLGKE
jgi:16S rRNA (cytosine967-C5)-methyltransferase